MLEPAPEIKWIEFADGYRAAARVWQTEKSVARVVCLHGIVSHGGWYLSSAAHLARHGLEVHLLDRRGSGLNLPSRGHVDDWSTWVNDVVQYLERLEGDAPRILLGISWGGTLASAVARQRPDLLTGVGLLCPGLYSRKAANVVQRAALRLASVFNLGSKRVAIPLQDPALFTKDEQAQVYVAEDPLTLWRITISFALANLRLTDYATQAPHEIDVPLLAMLAEEDPITVNSLVRKFVEQTSNASKTIIEYQGASHTLEFEPDPSQYFADLTRWCLDVAKTGHLGPAD